MLHLHHHIFFFRIILDIWDQAFHPLQFHVNVRVDCYISVKVKNKEVGGQLDVDRDGSVCRLHAALLTDLGLLTVGTASLSIHLHLLQSCHQCFVVSLASSVCFSIF